MEILKPAVGATHKTFPRLGGILDDTDIVITKVMSRIDYRINELKDEQLCLNLIKVFEAHTIMQDTKRR